MHGGVTYASHPWVGFDTAHAGDMWPPEWDELSLSDRLLVHDYAKRWTPQLVAVEAQGLARQVARVPWPKGAARFANLDIDLSGIRTALEGGMQ